MLLKEHCKTCLKPIKSIQTTLPHGKFITYVWNCGHIEVKSKEAILPKIEVKPFPAPLTEEQIKVEAPEVIETPIEKTPEEIELEDKLVRYGNPIWKNLDGTKELYDYQKEGVEFLESAKLRALCADAMGVGKTMQALLAFKRNKAILTPTICIVPSAIIFQWLKEYNDFVSKKILCVMPIIERHNIIPGFEFYIISRDFIGRKGVIDLLIRLNPKCLIIDEVQGFKDSSSQRHNALIRLIEECNIQYLLPLSGTPIKNRCIEYFPILNLLDPINFSEPKKFRKKFLNGNDRLNPYMEDEFKQITARYIIRREKHEVLKDLPPLTRDYQLIEIEDPGIRASYNHTLGLYASFKNNAAGIESQQILGWLAKLRAITGMAKVQYAVEWVNEFLDSTEDSIAIGIHHHDVRETLFNVFSANNLNPLSLSGLDDSYAKNRIANQFNAGHNRVLVISSLAGGVGLNLQSCANALVLEREWNSADEEQFEARFHRNGQVKGVTITYMIAKGTIDEFFHEMVRNKRGNLASVNIGEEDSELNSLQSLKDFAEFVASNTI